MNHTLFAVLKKIRDDKRTRKIAPDYIPFSQLPIHGSETSKLRADLNELFSEGYIVVHRGLNEQLIEIIKE